MENIMRKLSIGASSIRNPSFRQKNVHFGSRNGGEERSRSRSPTKGTLKKALGCSDDELFSQLSKFSDLKKDSDGVFSLSINGRRLLDGPHGVILEFLRRFRDQIQHFSMTNCYMDDDQFATISPYLGKLKALKTLRLSSNMLTTVSLHEIIVICSQGTQRERMSRAARFLGATAVLNIPQQPIEILDLRNNNMNSSENDGLILFQAFFGTNGNIPKGIKELNGMKIEEMENKNEKHLDLNGMNFRLMEITVMTQFLMLNTHIFSVNLANNFIDSQACQYFAEKLMMLPHITDIDMSNNPLTNEEKDFKGIDSFVFLLHNSSNIKNLIFSDGIIKSEINRNKIENSLKVNRSLRNINELLSNKSFDDFIREQMNSRGMFPKPQNNPKINLSKDVLFCQRYDIPERTVIVAHNSITLGLIKTKK